MASYGMANYEARDPIILVAEDDKAHQELLRRAFKAANFQFKLIFVDDGEQALNYLKRKDVYVDPNTSPTPDLLLLDINMPKVDGWEVLEEVRKDENLKGLAVVILSTSEAERDIRSSYDLGCNSFVSKPKRLDEFKSQLATLISYWFNVASLPDS